MVREYAWSASFLLFIHSLPLEEAYNFMKARGSNVDAGILFERWARETPGLEEIGSTSHCIPIGPWDTCKFTTATLLERV
jgi:hypothetical protein